MKTLLLSAVSATAIATSALAGGHAFDMSVAGTYESGVYFDGAAEIAGYDLAGQRIFFVNGADKTIDVLDASNPAAMTKTGSHTVGKLNSIAVANGIVAAVVEGEGRGKLVLMSTDGDMIGEAEIGFLPDAVALTADGSMAVVANEAEPSDDYKTDPAGTISIVDTKTMAVTEITFDGVEVQGSGLHLPSPAGTSLAQDLEPEYPAISPDGKTAYVTLQENNALAVVDLETKTLTAVKALGYQDYNQFDIDASNKDGGINFGRYNVWGLYQPDAIAAFEANGEVYIASANEGDARDYDGYSEEVRVKDLTLDETAYPNAAALQDEAVLGRLKTTTAHGDTDMDGDVDQIIAYGGRSMSIWSAAGDLVWDSQGIVEAKTAELAPSYFNSNGIDSSFDSRSDDKGAEPEAVVVGTVGSKTYAFLGLERTGGIMVFDVTVPADSAYVGYYNNIDPSKECSEDACPAGDVGPEGLVFVPAEQSPTGDALLYTANEVSGTVTAWTITN